MDLNPKYPSANVQMDCPFEQLSNETLTPTLIWTSNKFDSWAYMHQTVHKEVCHFISNLLPGSWPD